MNAIIMQLAGYLDCKQVFSREASGNGTLAHLYNAVHYSHVAFAV